MDVPASRRWVGQLEVLHTTVRAAARFFCLTLNDLRGDRRFKTHAHPRMVAMAVARQVSGASYPEIARAFGGKHHTSVMSACRRVAGDAQLAEVATRFRVFLMDYLAKLELHP